MSKKTTYAVFLMSILTGYAFILASQPKKIKPFNTYTSSLDPSKKIVLVPLGKSISKSVIDESYAEIKNYLPNTILADRLMMPASTYYTPRNRYRADSLIKWMSARAKKNEVIMGITTVDISTTKGKHKDWGVMGLAYKPGNAGVASSYRLKNKSAFWKIIIHELGHTAGLPHCPVKTCFMRDAEGGDHTGEEKEFCSKCKKVLVKNGWLL
jgi:archaemetzincin